MIKSKKTRLDNFLVSNNFFKTRERAQTTILSGDVIVNEEKISKPGKLIPLTSKIVIKKKPPYVSRGGEKLIKAIQFCLVLIWMIDNAKESS